MGMKNKVTFMECNKRAAHTRTHTRQTDRRFGFPDQNPV